MLAVVMRRNGVGKTIVCGDSAIWQLLTTNHNQWKLVSKGSSYSQILSVCVSPRHRKHKSRVSVCSGSFARPFEKNWPASETQGQHVSLANWK